MHPQKYSNIGFRKTPLSLFRFATLLLIVTLLLSCSHHKDVREPVSKNSVGMTGEVQILQAWHGDYPVAQLNRLPEEADRPGIGYIGDSKTFERVWSAFQPDDSAPDLDFSTNLVLFVRNTQYFNRLSIGRVMLKDGIAEVLAMETMSARPIEDVVAMSMVMVARNGIAGIQARGGVIEIAN